MKPQISIGVALLAGCSLTAQAEFKPLSDSDLAAVSGQAGITLDIDLSATIGEIRYVDRDGLNGDKGSLGIKGIRVGSITDFDQALSALAAPDTATISGLQIDADGNRGLVIGGARVEDLDIDVAEIHINGQSVGGLEVENMTNVLSADHVDFVNDMFDEGFTSVTGDFHIVGRTEIRAGGNFGSEGLTLTNYGGGAIGRLSYVDDGNEFGATELMSYRRQDEVADGVDYNDDGDQNDVVMGSTRSTVTVDVIEDPSDGKTKLALTNLSYQGTIVYGNIYVGNAGDITDLTQANNRPNSLGSLYVTDIDVTQTQAFIYGH